MLCRNIRLPRSESHQDRVIFSSPDAGITVEGFAPADRTEHCQIEKTRPFKTYWPATERILGGDGMNDTFLNIQPSPLALVQSLRDIGYSMESAIADVIDNSITAEAENIHVRFAWNDGSPWLAVIDDGCGMTPAELTDAMRLGSKNPLEERSKNDLGRFGLGLKTASFSQCRQLTLISRKDGM